MTTFRDLFDVACKGCGKDDRGYILSRNEWGIQVYDRCTQMNIGRKAPGRNINAEVAIRFEIVPGESAVVKIYECTQPGYISYTNPYTYSFDATTYSITMIKGGAQYRILIDHLINATDGWELV